MSSSFSHTSDDKLLGEQLDWLTVDHDDLRQDLVEQTVAPKYHPSMAMIDHWETDSIARIRQTAVLARRTLIDALDQHLIEVKKTLNHLTPILRAVRDEFKPFNGNDIQRWATTLHQLKQIPKFLVSPMKSNCRCGLTIDLRKQGKILDTESFSKHAVPCHSLAIIRDYPSSMSDPTHANNSKDIQIDRQSSTSRDFPIYSKIQRPSHRWKKRTES